MRTKSPWLMCHPFFVFAGWFDKKFIVQWRTYLGIPRCAVIPPQICLFYEVYGRMRCYERLCAFPLWLKVARVEKNIELIKDIGSVVSGSERDAADEMNRSRAEEQAEWERESKPNGVIQFKGWLSVKVDKRVICMAFSGCKYWDASW